MRNKTKRDSEAELGLPGPRCINVGSPKNPSPEDWRGEGGPAYASHRLGAFSDRSSEKDSVSLCSKS